MNAFLRPVLLLWVASAALFSVSQLAGLILLAVSVFRFPDECRELGRRVQTSEGLGTYGLGIGLFVFIAYWLMQAPAPSDDLLRHIPGYAYGYSHRAIFPHSSIPDLNLYPAFEHAVGALSQAWGSHLALQAVMALAWICAMLLGYGLVHNSGATLSAGSSVLLCLLFSTALSERLFLGRPEVFGVLWAVAAILCRGKSALALWAVGGILFSCSYWLFPLYLVSVLLLPVSWRARFAVGAALGLFHFGFWSWHAGSLNAYLDILRLIPEWTRARVMPVMETGSIWQMFARPPLLVLTLLGLTGLSQLESKKRLALCLVGAAVLLTNMVRYSAVFALLMFVAAMPLVPAINGFARKHLGAAVFVLVLPLLTAGIALQSALPFSKLPRFQLPAGATVLTGFNSATFALPFFNPGKVQMIPAMELGASELPYQLAAKAVRDGKLACSDIAGLTVTHVVENSQRTMPACLRLQSVQGDWRLWEVSHGR